MPLQKYVQQVKPLSEHPRYSHVDKVEILLESKKSDKYEKDVADALDKIKGVTAERPKVSTAYPDVLVTAQNGNSCWIEVKMNHTDNLGNPRVFYDGNKWDTTYTTTAAQKAVELLKGEDIAIIGCGNILGNCLEAAEKLKLKNVNCSVINMHTIKPIDKEKILDLASKNKLIFTVEEHSAIGGLNSMIAEINSKLNFGKKHVPISIPNESATIGSERNIAFGASLSVDHSVFIL